MKATISKRTVDGLANPDAGEARLWDDRLAGFCVRAYPKRAGDRPGRKVYAVKYRVGPVQRWLNIGEHGAPGPAGVPWTPDTARARAMAILGAASEGIDKSAERRELRAALTVSELITAYLTEGPATKPNKRASSWSTDRSNLERHIRPLLGSKLASAVTRGDATKALKDVAAGKTAADVKTKARGRAIVKGGSGISHRVLTSTRAMFTWALDHDPPLLAGPNPFAKIKLPPRQVAERFLSAKEAMDLFSALDTLETTGEISKPHASIIRLLLLTGARRNEIAALRWSEVDLDRGVLLLPPDRTKAGGRTGERRITLNKAANALINSQTRVEDCPWVFPATKGTSGHTTAIPKVWREVVRPAAKLPGLRIHDLRHSFASFAMADGASLAIIGKALGHASSRTTERYAHLADDPLRALSEGVGSRITKGTPQ